MKKQFITTKPQNIPFPKTMTSKSMRYEGVEYAGPASFAKSIIIEFLKDVFESFQPGDYKYDEDILTTEIVISDRNTFNLAAVDKRPALIVERGALMYTKTGGIDRVESRHDQFLTEKRIKTDVIQGSATVNCYGMGSTLQSEALADTVFQLFNVFDVALRHVGFKSIFASTIGREIPIETNQSAITYICTPVEVQFTFVKRWSIESNNLRRLKNVLDSFTTPIIETEEE